ncbi:MAG: phosphohydrolase [Rhodospirillaceae bacterium]|nr:MAG: phosphohydrolase [Rhodospirillaceae bacterium]
MNKTICIYHGNCADGFTAAWAVWRKYGVTADYHAGVYQSPPPDVRGRHVFLVDFSYKLPVLEKMADIAASVVILDHHKTAAEDLQAIKGRPNVKAHFDLDRSGAMMAWQYFHPEKDIPRLVHYVQDRDLWRFEIGRSRDFAANLFSYAYDFSTWDRLAAEAEDDGGLVMFLEAGRAIERKHHKDIAELLKVMQHRMTIGGYDVPVANLPYIFSSDAGHQMAQGELFSACYYDKPDGREFSLRSAEDGIDVSEIAKRYDGGGHKHAAGFRLPHGVEP